MKRLFLICGAVVGLLLGTSAMPAHAVTGGQRGCSGVMQETQFYTTPPLHSPHTDSTPWINPGYPWQIYIFVGSSQYEPLNWQNFYSDHNIELGNGVRWGFRTYALNGSYPEGQPIWHTETKTWTTAQNVVRHCTWIGTSYISGGTLVSGTIITYSD